MPLSPLKFTEQGCFSGKLEFLYFGRAQVRARVLFDVKNEFFNRCRVGFHFESLWLNKNWRKYPCPYPPWKSQKRVFFWEAWIYFIFSARRCARVLFDVKNEFVNRCRVGFHFKSLSLHENWRKYRYPYPPRKTPFFGGGVTILKDVIFGFVSRWTIFHFFIFRHRLLTFENNVQLYVFRSKIPILQYFSTFSSQIVRY